MNKEKLIIYGKHAVFSALNNSNRKIDELMVSEGSSELKEAVKVILSKTRRQVKLKIVTSRAIENVINNNVKHQGILAKSYKLKLNNYKSILIKKNKMKDNLRCGVILDRLNDPNNIGAVYRSAKAFGINFILNTNKHSALENSTILNSACGAFDTMQTFTTNNISNAIKSFTTHGWWTVGLDHEANANIEKILGKMRISDKIIFVLGSEGKGIRRLIKKNCSFIASIPNVPDTHSINVSNAAAIVFYEAFKLFKDKD